MGKKILLLGLFSLAIILTASAQISVLGSLTRSRDAVPGEEYEGTVALKNTGNSIAQAKVYLRDYTFTADGETGYLDPGSLARSNAGWVSLSASTVVLAPEEMADIKYTVNIPASGSLAGTYWSIIFVEAIPEDETDQGLDVPSISIRQVMRYGVQIVTDFADGGDARLSFSNTRILKADNGRFFSIDLLNSGTRWLNGDISMEVYSAEGEYVTTLTGGKFRTYPQTSVRKNFNLEALAPGNYKALLIADCGGDDLFGGNYNLVLKE